MYFKFLYALISTTFVFAAPPQDLPPPANTCVPYSTDVSFNSIKDYANYINLPGARFPSAKQDDPPNTQPALKIYSVDPVANANPPQGIALSNYITIYLQPGGVSDSALFPMFVLRCDIHWLDEKQTGFEQVCKSQDAPHQFAVTSFYSKLDVQEHDSSFCGGNQTLLSFAFVIHTDRDQVSRIKTAMASAATTNSAAASASAVGSVFSSILHAGSPTEIAKAFLKSDEAFIKVFYQNFYDGWVQSLALGRK